MTIQMNDSQVNTLKEIQDFLNSSFGIKFEKKNQKEAYSWVEQTLVKFGYGYQLNKKEKSLVKEYLQRMTSYSRSQMTRLISQYFKTGRVRLKEYLRQTFPQKYTALEIALLARTDELHSFPNGAALKTIFRRMSSLFGDLSYQKLAGISVAHIYNLRKTATYQRVTKNYHKTKPAVSNLGERRKPQPEGKPGYLRVDTVHQGDRDNQKGVYHINTIDEVTQFEFVGAVEKISERYLLPLLEKLLDLYPFMIKEFHADNGSEYINQIVVKLLNKLLIDLTKSRPRQSNDNALVEGKNGSVIRKWLGYSFMEQQHAERINQFYFGCFNEYLNYHRPCAFATEVRNQKGKVRKVYKVEDYQTPYEKLTSLDNPRQYLKEGITLETLEALAQRLTDNDMAALVQKERTKLYDDISKGGQPNQPVTLMTSGSLLD